MATEQYFQEDEINCASLEKCKSESNTVDQSENNLIGGFDCNICLDTVRDPVVTLCGHLYCWPCIYKWIHYQSVSADHQHPQCPACKTEVSQKTLIPLYGRGQTTKSTEGRAPHLGLIIPRRPPGPRCGVDSLSPHPAQQIHHRGYSQRPQPYYSHPMETNVVHPTMGVYGEMVYARIFGNPETTLHTYPNSYYLAGSNSPRSRRHVMQAEKSVSRVCFFLCCCVVLCLLLF